MRPAGTHWTARARVVAGSVAGVAVVALMALLPASAPASGPMRHPAVLRCDQLAEDSAAHVRLVRYRADGVEAYRCTRGGY